MRLIDADALKKAFEDRRGTNIHYNDVIKLIDSIPTFDVTKNQAYDKGFITAMRIYSKPQGEWILVDDERFIAKCSVCGRTEDSRMIKYYLFCHCGARMKGSDMPIK